MNGESHRVFVLGYDELSLTVSLLYSSWGYQVYFYNHDIKKRRLFKNGLINNHWPKLKEEWSLYKKNIHFVENPASLKENFYFYIIAFNLQSDNYLLLNGLQDFLSTVSNNDEQEVNILLNVLLKPNVNEKIYHYLEKEIKRPFHIIYAPYVINGDMIDNIFNPKHLLAGCHNDYEHFLINDLWFNYIEKNTEIHYLSPIEVELSLYFQKLSYQLQHKFQNECLQLCHIFNVDYNNIFYRLNHSNDFNNEFINDGLNDINNPIIDFALTNPLLSLNNNQQIIEMLINICIEYREKTHNKNIAIIGLENNKNTLNIYDNRLLLLIKELLNHQFAVRIYDENILHIFKSLFSSQDNIYYGSDIKTTIKNTQIVILNKSMTKQELLMKYKLDKPFYILEL